MNPRTLLKQKKSLAEIFPVGLESDIGAVLCLLCPPITPAELAEGHWPSKRCCVLPGSLELVWTGKRAS